MSTTRDSSAAFSHYDKYFQEKIIHAMILDRKWSSQFCEVVKAEFFEFAYLRKFAECYLDYYNKYKDFPSLNIMKTVIKESLKNNADMILRDQIIDFIKRTKSGELENVAFVKEQALDFCRKMALRKALEECVDLVSTSKYESTVDVVRKAINLGSQTSAGLDLENDVEVRYSDVARKTIATGILELDEKRVLNGGLGAGELGIVVAPTGVGKSHVLVHMGASAILQGKNVLHYTFELREASIAIRYDSHLVDIDSTDCPDHKAKIKEFYKDNSKTLGKLKVKHYPTSTVTCNQLRGHIERLTSEGFIPDMIIVDYAGIMRSSERYELLRLEMKKVCEELRAFADELACPLWTAIQSNKEGAESDIIDLTNMAEAYAQAHVADFVIGVSRKAKATGMGKIFIAKNRAGMDGIDFTIHLDTARSKLRVLTDQDVSDDNDVDRSTLLNAVRKSYKAAKKPTAPIPNPTKGLNLKPAQEPKQETINEVVEATQPEPALSESEEVKNE